MAGRVLLALWLVRVRGGGEHHVAQGNGHERAALRRKAGLERLDLDVRERDEVSFGGVEIVGETTPIAVPGQTEDARYSISGGLHDDPFVSVLHGGDLIAPAAVDAILGRMAGTQPARWWDARRAQNRKPATYRCPLCGRQLAALSEHMLLVPEGDSSRRRHAHTKCVLAARRQGRLPTRGEWLRTQPRAPSVWRRLFGRKNPRPPSGSDG